MGFCKTTIGLLALVAAVTANHYGHYEKPHHHKGVQLHKLCSWNVVEFEKPALRGDTWHPLKLDAGRNYIPENNIPTGMSIAGDGRVFFSLARKRTGVYATLAYFNVKDIRDGCCPKLTPYPSHEANSLDTDCANAGHLVSVERFVTDACSRLWVLDKQGMDLNDKNWVLGSPKLVVFDLKTDKVLREVKIPSEYYGKNQFGLTSVMVNSDEKDCGNSHAYLIDNYNGAIIVYSWKQDKFWRVTSPEFYNNAKHSKFTIMTRKNKEVTYWRNELVYDCIRDYKRNEVMCHSVGSLDEWTLPFAQLESEEVARCSPDSLDVKFLGQKCRNAQTSSHFMMPDNQVVWSLQELNHGVACWNRENKLNAESVHLVVSDRERLPYVVELDYTTADFSPYCGAHGYHEEKYIAVLTNNLISIKYHGFDHKEENFAVYFFRESEALHAYPQCLPQKHHPRVPARYGSSW